jgi:hypothetical protein
MSAESQPKFELQSLLDEAVKQAGGPKDFGDPSFREGLDVLCRSLETEARLSPLGRQLLHQKFVELLVNRLRIEDYFKRHPEIENEILLPPLVIVGLPRTGTTLLQRLLSCDPHLYSMAWWESRYPVPFPGESLKEPKQRIERARGEVKVMIEAMPKLLSIHPMDADQADEEVMLMEHSFISAMDSYANVPSYLDWLDRTDETPAYDYLKRVLKFLQWQKRQRGISAQRWVLKTPHHLLRMALLLKVFPGAKVIQTHRDPLDTIPSIASFIDTLWHIYGADPDPAAAGHLWSTRMARALAHTMEVREKAPKDQFFDVQFIDTVKRPFDVVRDIYAFAGMQLTPEAEQAMHRWMEENRRDTRGAHEYETEHFGLSPEQLKRDFAAYRARYVEPAAAGARR